MRPSTWTRLAWGGSTIDALRVVFTALGALLATVMALAAATVNWLPATEKITELGGSRLVERFDPRYTSSLLNETDRRPWLAAMLLLLALPALVFAAQSSRLGAPARDRRLAAIRLVGASAAQTRLVGVAESVAACLIGAFVGVGVFLVLREVADRPVMMDLYQGEGIVSSKPTPHLPLPTDALPPMWVFPLVIVAMPVLGGLLAAAVLRRVAVTPLAVTRRAPSRRLRWWPLVLVAVGFTVLIGHYFIGRTGLGDQDLLLPLTAWSTVLLLAVGVSTSAAPLGQLVARAVHARTRRPAPLLAARWIIADPWSGSRSLAVILISLLLGSAAFRGLAYLRAEIEEAKQWGSSITGWITESGVHQVGAATLVCTIALSAGGLLFAIVEGLLTRRRALAALVATGTPHGVLARAVFWQALLPALPAVALAVLVGTAAMASAETRDLDVDGSVVALAAMTGGTLLAVAGAAALSLLVLRDSVTVAELRAD